MAERWHARLEQLLEHQLRGRQPLVLYASHPDFEQTNAIQGELGEGTGGVTESLRRRIVLPLGGPLADTDHVIGHELVHAFQFDMTTRPDARQGRPAPQRLPLWFIEGMAEYLSLGPVDPHTAMWLRDAARQETLPTINDLDNPKYFPYRWGQAFWAYVGGRWGDEVDRQHARRSARQRGDTSVRDRAGPRHRQQGAVRATGMRRSASAYRADARASTTPPSEVGRVVIEGQRRSAAI